MSNVRAGGLDLRDDKTHALTICGKVLKADVSGALYWPGERALIVADLHLGKASAAAERGRHLPPYDTRATLLKLAAVLDRFDPAIVVSLGDSLHDPRAAARLEADNLAILHMLQEGRRWIWVTGNHDPVVAPALGGEVCSELTLEGMSLRHEPRPGRITHEIAAHMHPAAKLTTHGQTIRRPCFVGNGRRLVVPAFGALTGGLNVLSPAFGPIFGDDGLHVYVLGEEGLYPIAARLLRDD
jgi:uncharacterized protein